MDLTLFDTYKSQLPVYAETELIHNGHLILVRRIYLLETDVKRMKVNRLVEMGNIYLCINENPKFISSDSKGEISIGQSAISIAVSTNEYC
jgi:hypothetical protein